MLFLIRSYWTHEAKLWPVNWLGTVSSETDLIFMFWSLKLALRFLDLCSAFVSVLSNKRSWNAPRRILNLTENKVLVLFQHQFCLKTQHMAHRISLQWKKKTQFSARTDAVRTFWWNTHAKLNDIMYCVFSAIRCMVQISRDQLWSSQHQRERKKSGQMRNSLFDSNNPLWFLEPYGGGNPQDLKQLRGKADRWKWFSFLGWFVCFSFFMSPDV